MHFVFFLATEACGDTSTLGLEILIYCLLKTGGDSRQTRTLRERPRLVSEPAELGGAGPWQSVWENAFCVLCHNLLLGVLPGHLTRVM